MIHFENINYLYFGVALPLLIVAYFLNHRRQLKATLKIGDRRLVNNLISGASGSLSFFKFMLLLLAFVAFIIAFANPLSKTESSGEVDLAKTKIVFVVDVSKSMLAADVIPNRLQQVQNFILQTVKELNGEQVGMVLFAAKASPYFPCITDYNYVASATKSISNDLVLSQGTSLREALKVSSFFFNAKNSDVKVLCVLSDGESHSHGFEKLSDSLRRTGINLFAFGAGTITGATLYDQSPDGTESIKKDKNGLPVVSHLNEENLMRITGNNASYYFRLTNKENAKVIFINDLKKLEDHVPQKKWESNGNFQIFLIIGLALLILEIVIAPNYVYQKN